jgi:ABC-type transport system involved in multi-copper enzyme maturation permease subunit
MGVGMNNVKLLRVMMMKEVRSTFRERAQLGGIAISILVLLVVMGGAIYQTRNAAHRTHSNHHVVGLIARSALGIPGLSPPEVRWALIGACTFVGFFFSMGYLISAVLACFVGEKESKTLEILLAAPLSDSKLFTIKCISALLPSFGICVFFLSLIAILFNLFVPEDIANLSAGFLFSAVVMSLPILVMIQLCLLGLGASISLKSETMKGASQIFGVVFMVLFFGVGYGTPALLMFVPSLREFLLRWAMEAMKLEFVTQYGVVLLICCVPAVVLMGVARACFQRDRMLS